MNAIKEERNGDKMYKKKHTLALKQLKAETLKDVLTIEQALIENEEENQRLHRALREARRNITENNEIIHNQA